MLASRAVSRDAPAMMQAAEHFVGHHSHSDVAHDDLVALAHDLAIDGARLMRRPSPAPAQGRHLENFDAISELDEAC